MRRCWGNAGRLLIWILAATAIIAEGCRVLDSAETTVRISRSPIDDDLDEDDQGEEAKEKVVGEESNVGDLDRE